MPAATRHRIAIIGAGFSGSLLAVQLLRRFAPKAHIYLIEQNMQFGRGLAYSTGNSNHLLNVRARRMSAFADDPDHFIRWLATSPTAKASAQDIAIGPDTFVPRGLYGSYIQELLGNEIWRAGKGKNLYLVPDEAVAIRPRANGLSVEVRGGRRYAVDCAVLAIGNVPNAGSDIHYIANPWSAEATAELDPDAEVLLTGTGLTMVDTVVSLIDQGHRGTIHAVSRRGLLPRRHGDAGHGPPLVLPAKSPRAITDLLRHVRLLARADAGDPSLWRSVIDGLRPHTQSLWQSLDDAARRRFLRHLRPWWEVHRHRMAPEVADRIEALIAEGRLRIWAARIEGRKSNADGVSVTIRPRGTDDRHVLRVGRWIDCSGPQCDYSRIENPLIQDLLAQGAVRPDSLRLGLDVTPESALVDRWGIPSERLFALGPMTRGTFWEITSVPDIREQCWHVAKLLGRRLSQEGVAAGGAEAILPVASQLQP